MQLRPTITFEEYRNTCQATATAKPTATRKRTWKEYAILGVVCLALGISPHFPLARVPALTIFIVIVLLCISSKPLTRRSREQWYKEIFSEEQHRLNDQVLIIDETGIFCDQSNGQVTSHHRWTAFMKCLDLSDAFVFLPSPNSFVRVPKGMLSSLELRLVQQWSSRVPTVVGS